MQPIDAGLMGFGNGRSVLEFADDRYPIDLTCSNIQQKLIKHVEIFVFDKWSYAKKRNLIKMRRSPMLIVDEDKKFETIARIGNDAS